ncbi:hypothetical protein AYX14_06199 [Cryptococcus neoformans]|nr:hypothetical protein AYX14_06199 [Cryptococcus neoformans var. grubii]
MEHPPLPLDVLSNVAALIPPPYYPWPPPTAQTTATTPAPDVIRNLDPAPTPLQTDLQAISAITRASSRLLEAARPWLWEDVDVKTGRGWLAIVNALTEEVIEQDVDSLTPIAGSAPASDGTGSGRATPVPPPEPSRQPGTIPQATQAYTSPSSAPLPFPIVSGSGHVAPGSSAYPQMSTSPPQPTHIHQLLTPPTSRNTSPRARTSPALPPILTNPQPRAEQSPSPGPPGPPGPSAGPGPSSVVSPSAVARTKLRGRSRSPRRSVGFDTEGIQAVLERSRSVSSPRSGGPNGSVRGAFMHRRTSLSRSRTWHDGPRDEEEDEDEDEVMPLTAPPARYKAGVITPRLLPAEREIANADLLPPPGPYIRHLNFTNFRTIGSRRSQEEAVRGRFVTAGRLEGVIKNAPNLVSLCMTEYVDSSLSYPVIEEIFFRGSRRPRYHSPSLTRTRSLSVGQPPSVTSTAHDQLDPPRPEYVPYEDETEDQKWNRRAMFTPLEALDLTGCVSQAFTEAMQKFYNTWLAPEDETEDEEEERGRGRWRGRGKRAHSPDATEDDSDTHSHSVSRDRQSHRRPPRFRAMRRLCLRMCTSLDSQIIASLVWSFPCLTHLDLSNTRVPDELLNYLTDHCPRAFRLTSLSLARCPRLNSYAVVDFLCRSPAVRDLVDLNLYVNPTQGKAIESDALMRLITEAPCIRSGRLRYLDLSSAKFTPAHLAADVFPPQPSLISLGLSHIPTLGLTPIADFMLSVAFNVEILTLVGTATTSSLDPSRSPLQITLELHSRLINPLTTIPFSLASLYLSPGSGTPANLNPGPTRLRVIELIGPIRRSIAPDGNGEWKVVKSKGSRGWYVDQSAGWRRVHPPPSPSPSSPSPLSPASEGGAMEEGDTEAQWEFVRHLPKAHPRRAWLNKLSEASGRVGSNVGWHSRKMEVVRGMGMMGREEGMAGAGAFAFEE